MLDLGSTFLQSVERSPHALALVDGPLRLTYAQWFAQISAVAAGLQRIGLGHGDRLLAILQNRHELATLHWACQFLGVVITPFNWRAKPEEADYCAADAAAAAVVFEPVSAGAVAGSAFCRDIPRIAVGGATGGTIAFAGLSSVRAPPMRPAALAGDLSVLLYTSGTTGRPKGVQRSHRAERAAALAHVAQNLYRTGEAALGVMPLYHTMGVRSLLAMALVDGAFVCVPRFDAGECLKLIERERISHLYLVPTLYHDLLGHADFEPRRLATVTRLGFAGAPMSEALLKRLDAAFKPQLFVNHYGSSEIYTFTIMPDAASKPGCAGRAGVNARIRVVSLDAGERTSSPEDRVAVREEGQIIADMASDEAFEGYWRRPDADARALRQGWYYTGDTGYFDEDGDLFVTGRVDDMIISGGENISPVEVESALSLHPAVEEVAVAGLPDERWGQRVVAFIKPRSHVDPPALDEFARGSGLMSFKRPREYVFVREIPKSPVGKILRRKLVAGEYAKF
ncbi:MAG: AMP-binding protein [Burkholderiales bacterium]